MDKLERLLTVMNVLLATPRAITARDLRDRVPGYPEDEESFRRAFERDKDELRAMGVPLLVEDVPGSDPPIAGYRIRAQDYELRDPGLDPEELEALNLAAAMVGVSGGLSQSALFKLGGAAADAPQAELPVDPDLVTAFSAVAERQRVTFTYNGVRRLVDPYRLQFVRGRWYLNGFDATRAEDRWFRLNRVEGAIEASGPTQAFERPIEAVPGLQLDPWVVGTDGRTEAVEAQVWFDPLVAPAVLRTLAPSTEVLRNDDTGLVVALSVTNREGFRSWVLSHLDRAEVLAPPELRAELVAWLEERARG